MDTENPVIAFCIQGTQAEYANRPEDARALYRQAWDAAQNDYEACVAAHYLARLQENPKQALHWNQVALARAESAGDARVGNFYPSLYVNLGRAHETLGHLRQARDFYRRAAQLGLEHDTGDENRLFSV